MAGVATSVVIAATAASRASRESAGSRWFSGSASSVNTVPHPEAWTRFTACCSPTRSLPASATRRTCVRRMRRARSAAMPVEPGRGLPYMSA
jgi:hypothetical protein